MTRWIILAATVALVPVQVSSQAQANEPARLSEVINVFVAPPAATQQTTEVAASVEDLQKALKKQSSLRLVDTPEAAHVILSVQDRQRKSNLAGTVSYGDIGSAPTYNSWARLTVEVRGGGLSMPLVAQAKTWKGAASRAAGDVAKWVDVNQRILRR